MVFHHIQYSEIQSFNFIEPVDIFIESGGTKTDWRIIHKNEVVGFETITFHPRFIEEEQIQLIQFISSFIPVESSIHFYGSGCLQTENQNIIRKLFSSYSLKTLNIDSDLVAAGLAIYGDKDGYVGILGTGSVLCYYQNRKITDIYGGFGYLLGDEGSGYYFGKSIIQKYLNNELSPALSDLIKLNYGDKNEILGKVYGNFGKQFIGKIQLQSNVKEIQEEINFFHIENITLFLDKYIPQNKNLNSMGFVGSYAFYNQSILKEILKSKGISLVEVVQKPIDKIVELYFSSMNR